MKLCVFCLTLILCNPLPLEAQRLVPPRKYHSDDDDDDDRNDYNDDADEDDVVRHNATADDKGLYVGAPCEFTCSAKLVHVFCNPVSGTCDCEKKYPVKLNNPYAGCSKPKRLGDQCYYMEACQYTDQHSSCIQIHHNAICQCQTGYHTVSIQKPSKRVFCAEDVVLITSDFSTFAGVLSGIAILSGLICFVLHLFNQNLYGTRHRSRHRFGNANLAPPILFSSDPGSRRPSIASVHSMTSIRSYSARRYEREILQKEEREMDRRYSKLSRNNSSSKIVTPSLHSTDDLLPTLEEDRQEEFAEGDGRYKGGIPPCEVQKSAEKDCCLTKKDEAVVGSCCRRLEDKPTLPLKGILKRPPDGRPPFPPTMHATAGRPHPAFQEPPVGAPVPSQLRPTAEDLPPCYLPQPQDALPAPLETKMGPIGPWATGRVDWGPLAGLTGTRPIVDKYSITRYGEGEWRAHNKEVLDMSATEQHRANLIDWNGRQCLEQTQSDTDKNQEDNTKRLEQRALEILRWKCELERAIAAAGEEIGFMEEQRRRLKQASSVLTIPESIASECLDRRTGRMDSELVRDDVEDELIKEMALCSEIRDIFARTLKDVGKQLLEDKTAKQRLEYDWSDKKVSHEIDTTSMALNNSSTVLRFKPGAVCFPDEQSTPEFWEHFTRETLLEGEATRQRSVTLRGTLDAILSNAARDLRSQADRVEMALAKRIACTQEVTTRLENELRQVLRRLADVEDLKEALRLALRRMDAPMKKAQTRLDMRLRRPRVESCRDAPHFGLVEEVKTVGEAVAALQAQMAQAQESQAQLMRARSDLEREIMLKRKTLEIDNERTKRVRSHYPSATALSGY